MRLLQPVRLPLSVTVIGICPKTKQYNRWYSKLQLGGWLLQPESRCCSHCNEIQGASEYETTICLVQSLVLKIAASWAAVPAGCANEFQTMLWGCSSRHSKVGSVSCIFECWAAVPAGYDIYNNGYPFLLELEGGRWSSSVSPKKACSCCRHLWPEMLLNSLAVEQLGCCSRLSRRLLQPVRSLRQSLG